MGERAMAKKRSPKIRVRKIHRRDLNQVWEFLKEVFRSVHRRTVEYQRPRSRDRFFDVYDNEGVDQLVFEIDESSETGKRVRKIVGYAECAVEADSESYLNPWYFKKKRMKPLFVEEIAVHPDYQGHGVGAFIMAQLEHLARLRGSTHLVLEVAENNDSAVTWYRKRGFRKMDSAIIMAWRLPPLSEVLPPQPLPAKKDVPAESAESAKAETGGEAKRAEER